VTAGLLSFVVGVISLRRLRSDYQAMVMLLLSLMATLVASSATNLVNGPAGLSAVPQPLADQLNLDPVTYDWVYVGWAGFLAQDAAIRSNTSVCIAITDPAFVQLAEDAKAEKIKKMCSLLEKEGVALDIAGYRAAPPGLRIWCGATVERADLQALTPWLDWAFAQEKAKLAKAA
jgi:phosphoserine aminotransferase